MSIANVSLDDKYRLERGTVFLTGMQAPARLPMPQHAPAMLALELAALDHGHDHGGRAAQWQRAALGQRGLAAQDPRTRPPRRAACRRL